MTRLMTSSACPFEGHEGQAGDSEKPGLGEEPAASGAVACRMTQGRSAAGDMLHGADAAQAILSEVPYSEGMSISKGSCLSAEEMLHFVQHDRGSRAFGCVPAYVRATHSAIGPILPCEGKRPGPCLGIHGQVHGGLLSISEAERGDLCLCPAERVLALRKA